MTLALFLDAEGVPVRWWRDGGEGPGLPDLIAGERVVAIVPPDQVTLHWADLPARSLAQAIAAARLLIAEVAATPISDLHVAVGPARDDAMRPIAVVATQRMAAWLARLAALGVDPDAIVPAALLLPSPDEGFVRATIGGHAIIRAPGRAFADESGLTEVLTEGVAPVEIDPTIVLAGLEAALADPPLDLRQGVFARRRRRAIDWRLARRLGWLALAFGVCTLLIAVVKIVRYNLAAAAIEAEADQRARGGLGPGETVTDADRQLTQRLTRLQGGGAGFSRTAAALVAAARAVPGTRLTALDFQPNGTLNVTVSAPSDDAAARVQRRIEAAGFIVRPGALTNSGGRVTGRLTVSTR